MTDEELAHIRLLLGGYFLADPAALDPAATRAAADAVRRLFDALARARAASVPTFDPLMGRHRPADLALTAATAIAESGGHRLECFWPADGTPPRAACRACAATWTLGYLHLACGPVVTWRPDAGTGDHCPSPWRVAP